LNAAKRVGAVAAGRLIALLLTAALWGFSHQAQAEPVRVGVLKFGTVAWELEVIKHHGLDRKAGFELEVVPFASTQATKVGLQAGALDVIVSDWFWVSRQRAAGANFTFAPYSRMVGALLAAGDAPIRNLADLKGKRLGIAGGPLDKSWLLFRALATERHGMDLDAEVDKVFGAPPLLSEQILSGRIDAVITYWHYTARLEAKGLRRVIDVAEAIQALGVNGEVPLLGYVFAADWAEANRESILGFLKASRDAKAILGESDDEWLRIQSLTRAKDATTLAALRHGYRAGIPTHWGEAERGEAARLFALLGTLGGEKLVGPRKELQAGTFWPGLTY
jgi:NitT/TauT family transport system substrate-binding protein